MVAIVYLLAVLVVSVLVTRIATVALVHTGLSRESARFQARSAFTGVGFTTAESERVVNHPVRRRIILALMLLGNVGIVTFITSSILGFVRETEQTNVKVLMLVAGLLAIWAAARSKWVDRWISTVISRMLRRYTRLEVRDYSSLLHLAHDYRVTELAVQTGDWIANRSLKELRLRDEGILILGIQRSTGDYVGAPRGATQIHADDTIIVYGKVDLLNALDKREKGFMGDLEHEQAVEDQQRSQETGAS